MTARNSAAVSSVPRPRPIGAPQVSASVSTASSGIAMLHSGSPGTGQRAARGGVTTLIFINAC